MTLAAGSLLHARVSEIRGHVGRSLRDRYRRLGDTPPRVPAKRPRTCAGPTRAALAAREWTGQKNGWQKLNKRVPRGDFLPSIFCQDLLRLRLILARRGPLAAERPLFGPVTQHVQEVEELRHPRRRVAETRAYRTRGRWLSQPPRGRPTCLRRRLKLSPLDLPLARISPVAPGHRRGAGRCASPARPTAGPARAACARP